MSDVPQPISTAPRDGTVFWAWPGKMNKQVVWLACYAHITARSHELMWVGQGNIFHPTHWMPMSGEKP